jgi:hypothetical protein
VKVVSIEGGAETGKSNKKSQPNIYQTLKYKTEEKK